MNRLAAIFPGQGSQHPGMGNTLADAYPEARAVFDAADAALEGALSATCFCGSEEELARTETTQPAILATSIAVAAALAARGFRFDAAAGHSLGEYSAHVAAGTLAFEDAVRAVRLRGRFMQEAVPVGVGAMAAVLGLERGALEAVCREVAAGEIVGPANLNGPGQIVIAGHAAAVSRAIQGALAAGARRAVPLPVSAPFHCPLMEPAAARLREVLAAITFRDPRVPVYTNVDAAPVAEGASAREALLRQVCAPVRWQEEVEAMVRDGVTTFVEVGPGKVLAGLVRRIAPAARVVNVNDPATLDEAMRVLETAA